MYLKDFLALSADEQRQILDTDSRQPQSKPLPNRHELICILQEHLTVTDEWGGCKLASWRYGYNVLVDGIDDAADAIIARLSNDQAQISSE